MKKLLMTVAVAIVLAACDRENETLTPNPAGTYDGYLLNETTGNSQRVTITVTQVLENQIKVESANAIGSSHLVFTASRVTREECCLKFNLASSPENAVRGLSVSSVCSEHLIYSHIPKGALIFRVSWGSSVFYFASI